MYEANEWQNPELFLLFLLFFSHNLFDDNPVLIVDVIVYLRQTNYAYLLAVHFDSQWMEWLGLCAVLFCVVCANLVVSTLCSGRWSSGFKSPLVKIIFHCLLQSKLPNGHGLVPAKFSSILHLVTTFITNMYSISFLHFFTENLRFICSMHYVLCKLLGFADTLCICALLSKPLSVSVSLSFSYSLFSLGSGSAFNWPEDTCISAKGKVH